MKKIMAATFFIIFLSTSTAFCETECVQEGWGSTTPNYMRCYPLPDDYTMADHSTYADTSLYNETIWWKLSLTYNPRYVALPYYSSSWDAYRFSLSDDYGPVEYGSALWGQEALKEDESWCFEFAYDTSEGNWYESGHHNMIYNLWDWAGCWEKMVKGEDGFLVPATEIDPDLTAWQELRECGGLYGRGMVYAEKFEDPESPDFIENLGCCGGVAIDWDNKCCILDSYYIPHIVNRNEDGSCPTALNPCEAGGAVDPCDLPECMDDDDCPIEVVSSKLFKEIGPIRKFDCPPEIIQCILGIVPDFPPGCNTSHEGKCCTYHEGLSLEIVTEDCNGNQSTITLSLHWGNDEDDDLGPIPVECSVQEEPFAFEEESPLSIPMKPFSPAEEFFGIAAPNKSNEGLMTAAADEEEKIMSLQAVFNTLPDDSCVIENNFNNGESVLICRCPELTPSGFCVKNLGVLEPEMEDVFTITGSSGSKKSARVIFSSKSSLIGKDGPLPVDKVCEILGFGGVSTEDLKDILGDVCSDQGDYDPIDNNCGDMHDEILERLGISDPNDLGDNCVVEDEECGDCLLGASDLE